MASDATLNLVISLKDEASKGLGDISEKTSILGTAMGVFTGGAILGGVTKLTGAVSDFFSGGIADAHDANLVFAQTQQVIKSTGGAAGVTAQQVADMAGSLSAASGKSLFGDDDIQRGTNMLLTFTNIKETLPDATQAMLDMAQATGTDAGGAAVQLGKALNDPVAGISALSRVGVTFTDQQKEQIATMMEAGNVAGAQGVILQELNKEFGGSAAAAAAADGGMAQFRDRMGEVGESIGQSALPLIQQFTAILNDPAVVAGIQAVATAITTGLGVALTWLTTTAIPALMAGWNTIQPALATVANFIGTNLQPILIGIGVAFTAWAVAAGIAAASTIIALAPVLIPIAAIGLAAAALKIAWDNNFLGIRDTLTAVWNAVLPVLETLKTWLATNIPIALQALSDVWNNVLLPAIKAVWDFVNNSLVPLLSSLANVVIEALKLAITALAGLWENVLVPALTAAYNYFNDNILPIIISVGNKINDFLNPIINTIAGAFDKWYTAIGGISGAISTAIGWLDKLASSIGKIKLPDWLTPGSPTPLEYGLIGIANAAQAAAGEMGALTSGTGGALPWGMTEEELATQQALLDTFRQVWTDTFIQIAEITRQAMELTEAVMLAATDHILDYARQAVEAINDLYNRVNALRGLDVHASLPSAPGSPAPSTPPGSPPSSPPISFHFYGPADGDDVVKAGRSVGLW
jgi:hypothetical protein